ncbi:XRE family transcriptional regulator [Streptomyces sp. 150FB]|uniref:helix-turn-helix transcriptional regulator n=1 Tax=Streptomyces sp. 150FB TaxID=1576605 RepID=UPI00058943BE|nr:helix-turn-helix transcriptional regulator [Streptomyces sp. 150FB]KIF74924.1 XRE family transcriptional regulator [Streptomyces sp. 150FB]
MEQNAELRDFLRSRRARITPEQAGIRPHPGPRRVPGLRREELALLAGVSTDYYARLEQGRDLNVSDGILDALAGALRLVDTERAHLYRLARRPTGRPRRSAPAAQRIRPGLTNLLAGLDHLPVFVIGHRMDVLASNHLAHALLTDFEAQPARTRNFARYIFLDPTARERFTEWDDMAADTVANLRRYSGRFPHDPRLAELVGELSVQDADFRTWWAAYDVHYDTYRVKHARHPVVGDLVFDCETLIFPDDPDLMINIFAVGPASESAARLRALARLGAE